MSRRRHPARGAVARGISAWERDDFESALATFEEVLEAHPYFADVHNKAGLCLAMLGRTEQALGHFEAALAINAAYAEAHLNRGIILNEPLAAGLSVLARCASRVAFKLAPSMLPMSFGTLTSPLLMSASNSVVKLKSRFLSLLICFAFEWLL